MSSLRVLHLTTLHPANDVRIYEKEAKSLSNAGYEVLLAGPKPKPISQDVYWIELPTPVRFRFIRVLLSQVLAIYAILKSKAKIIHIHDPELLLVAHLLQKFSKRTFIWDAHEDYYNQLDRWLAYTNPIFKPFYHLLSRLLGRLLDTTSRNFDCVIGATKEICIKYGNEKTILVGNEAVLENFEFCNPQFENNQVLLLSNSSSDAYFSTLIRAATNIPFLKIGVAGATQDDNTLKWASKLLGERFVNFGRLDRLALADKISESNIGIVAYPDIITNKTNSPNKFFEFAAAGLPVVCTPNDSLRCLIHESKSGLILRDYSPDALESAILDLLESKVKWSQMSINGRAWATDHGNWDISKSRLLDVYATLASEREVEKE